MSLYLCLNCESVYDGRYLSFKHYDDGAIVCPTIGCQSDNIFEIDEQMITPIISLNNKGYVTCNCCAGHLHEPYAHAYIQFDKVYNFDSIPEGWDCSNEGKELDNYDIITVSCLESIITGLTYSKERIENQTKLLSALYDWVDKLPDLNTR